jgi:DNA-binding transcriptional MerR regulator
MMNDFLHNLRSGKMQRPERHRKPYAGHQKTGHERGKAKDFRNGRYGKNIEAEKLNKITQIIASIAESQKLIAASQERKAKAEERKADILESFVELIKQIVSPDSLKPDSSKTDNKSADLETNLAPEVMLQKIDQPKKPNDANKKKTLELIHSMRKDGMSYEKVANYLDSNKIPTFSGRGKWRGQTIHRLCNKVPA